MPRYQVRQQNIFLHHSITWYAAVEDLSLISHFSLAYAEMYLTIARITSTFDMELYETTPEDLGIYHIRLTGYPKEGMGEVKANITGKV
jgi:hypothetical protein